MLYNKPFLISILYDDTLTKYCIINKCIVCLLTYIILFYQYTDICCTEKENDWKDEDLMAIMVPCSFSIFTLPSP